MDVMDETLRIGIKNIVERALVDEYAHATVIGITPVATARVNRVWFISVQATSKTDPTEQISLKYVIKLSNRAWIRSKTRTEVNALKALWEHCPNLRDKIPRVVAYCDQRMESDIQEEYILITRVPGTPLSELWPLMSSHQREDIILQLASLIAEFRRIGNFDRIGSFCLDGLKVGNLVALEYQNPEEQARGDPIRTIGPLNSFVDYMLSYMDIHIEYLESKQDPNVLPMLPIIKAFRDDVVVPNRDAWKEEKFVFTHGDLNAGNILIVFDGSNRPLISGLIDLEWAIAGPSDLEHHRCLRWLKDDANTAQDLATKMWDRIKLLGHAVESGVDYNSLRHDIFVVERSTSQLDSYAMWCRTPEEKDATLSAIREKLYRIAEKYSIKR